MRLTILVIFSLFIASCQSSSEKEETLFNGKDLTGWDVYVASAADSLPPLGLNNDPNHMFSAVEIDGGPALRVSGEGYGGISTIKEYENYHLTLQFKWGENKIPSFSNRKRDSGLLYHAVGPHGVDARAWMRSQEFQIQEGDCGDYWGVAGGTFDVPATKNDKNEWRYDKSGVMKTFSATSDIGRRCWKNPDAEKPTGEWNTLDLYCFGDSSVHIVNGTVVMRLYHSRQADNGTDTRLAKGKFQLQSEGCEIYYRGLKLHVIDKLPAAVL